MPGDEQGAESFRPHGVRRHGGITQPHHQRRALAGQQRFQFRPHSADGPLKKIRLPLPEGGAVDGQIIALRFAQNFGSLCVQNLHPSDGITLQLFLFRLDPGKFCGFFRRFLPKFPGLQRQIRSFCKHPVFLL